MKRTIERLLICALLISALGMTAYEAYAQTSKAQGGAPGKTQGKSPSKAPVPDKTLNGCICAIDEATSTVKIVPWDQDKKAWDSEGTKVFAYQDKTTVEGESKATVAELKSGTPVKTAHFEGISIPGGISATPFEIKKLSECIGRRTSLHWVDDKGTSIATRLELPYLFGGESMAAMVGNQGARSVGTGGHDDCPCQFK